MRTTGVTGVGRVSVEVDVVNADDLALARHGMLAEDKVRRLRVAGMVDSGAAMLVLPQSAVKQLGLRVEGTILVRYADGRRTQRRLAPGAQVELLGRHDTFTAVVEPKRTKALIGAIVLEALDLLVDCTHRRVVPRDPSGPVYEIE